jgi:hypothetical protein
MPRLMSVSLTEAAVVDRRKTVTRRAGWSFLRPGDRLTLCRKVMGRQRGEPLVRLVDVEVVSVRRERLDAIDDADVHREGFRREDLLAYTDSVRPFEPGEFAAAFVRFFCDHMRCSPDDMVTRIEWKYVPPSAQ